MYVRHRLISFRDDEAERIPLPCRMPGIGKCVSYPHSVWISPSDYRVHDGIVVSGGAGDAKENLSLQLIKSNKGTLQAIGRIESYHVYVWSHSV